MSQQDSSHKVVSGAVKQFFIRRFVELLGLVFILSGLALFIALATAADSDPTFNTASDLPVQNMLGSTGAIIADIFFQTTHLLAFLVPVSLVAWGVRLVLHYGLPSWQWRIPLLFVSVSLLAAFMHGVGVLTNVGSGGIFGLFFYNNFYDFLTLFSLPAWLSVELIVTVIYGIVGLFLYIWASCFSVREVKWVSRLISWLFWPLLALLRGLKSLFLKERAAKEAKPKKDKIEKPKKPKKSKKQGTRTEPVLVPGAETLAQDSAPSSKNKAKAAQASFDFEQATGFRLPPANLLKPPTKASKGPGEAILKANADSLEAVLGDFGVNGEISDVAYGPVVTRYGLNPAPGTKSQRVIALADDIARSMSALSVRVAVVPGQNVIGIELPNEKRETVMLRDILDHEVWQQNDDALPICLGKDIAGYPVVTDLAKMPHLLVAGTTGSGKSVGINAMILSLLYRHTPETCRLIMIDPKMLELSVYDGIPHLLSPVVTDPSKAVTSLKWAVREMENRYFNMSKLGVRNITGYNQRLAEARSSGEVLTRRVQTGFDAETGKPVFEEQTLDLAPLPYIVVIIDEVADLMLVAGKDIEAAVQRLAQMARAAGIHVIMATQRPSVDVITGTIKANFPTRISFQVTSKIDSRTILGEQGAEQLLGRGDMLFMEGGGRVKRVHGPFMEDREVEKVADFLRAQGEPEYDDRVTEDQEEAGGDMAAGAGVPQPTGESLYDQAVALVIREQKASTSYVQRHLKIGYNRAATIIEEMEKAGIISQANHVGKREVLIQNDQE